MKSQFKNRKVTTLLGVSLFLFYCILSLNPGVAIYMHDKPATFYLDKDDPLKYGAFHIQPNMYTTLSFQGSNQGEFGLMSYSGSEFYRKIVDVPGEDISEAYPQYLPSFFSTALNHDLPNPFYTLWLNVSAYNAENDTLSPYYINTAYNYYTMTEGSELNIPLNQSIPMQIDIMILSKGPKVLKYDWLTDNPAFISDIFSIVSPSGKVLNFDQATVHAISHGIDLFDFITFIAHETGTYRLLVYAQHAFGNPAYLNLEFLSSSISSLPLETLKFIGNGDEFLSFEGTDYSTWQSNWYRVSGKKGEIYSLELNKDYATGVEPIIRIWSPCENRYKMGAIIGEGSYDIYFPSDGYAYISFIDADYGDWYRYSVYLNKYEPNDYSIGSNKTTYRISRDDRKVIQFSIDQDSFVRFNFTSSPPGNPYLEALGTPNATIFVDSKDLNCYNITTPLVTKVVDNEWFHYYFMPAGNYKAIIKNTNTTTDGIFQISSKFVDFINEKIPISSLTYPETNPSQFITLDFEPDDYYDSLKNAIALDLNITEPGQYRLNTTMWAADNIGNVASADPTYVYSYSGGNFIEYNYSFEAFSDPADYFYIGFTSRWTGMEIGLSTPGVGGNVLAYSFDGGWDLMDFDPDGTFDLTQNGTMEFRETEDDFRTWIKGTGGMNIDDSIDESDFYWLRLDPTSPYATYPIIEDLKLTNITITGDINFALIGESQYKYGDYWSNLRISQPPSISRLRVSLDEEPDDFGPLEYGTAEDNIIQNSNPYIIGFEPGNYKLLIIPENWDYSGRITIQFAVENYWSYRYHDSYNASIISPNPVLHQFQVNNYTNYGYANGNGPFYDYGLTIQYNDTKASVGEFAGFSYFLLDCYGQAYQWTQLIVSANNVSSYNLYLMQDLPWFMNYPYGEVLSIASESMPFINNTHEFGVFTNHFYLLFEVDELAETITFRLRLSQYDTVELSANPITASYKPPLNTNLIIILAIVIPAAIGGAIVVIYILKKKRGGKI